MEKKTNRSGHILVVLGTALILLALGLLAYNENEQRRAARISGEVLQQMQLVHENTNTGQDAPEPGEEMPEAVIDGERYIGRLNIPALELQLPVLSQWSYAGLKKAPCRYSGSVEGKNLVLLGHNYKSHFGPLERLKTGDEVLFQDMNGTVQHYEVAAINTVKPTETEQITAGEYALTLFTCTYDGQYRTMVGCDVLEAE